MDGQQRLTTLSVVYAAIYTCLRQCDEEDEDTRHELFNLRHRLVFKGCEEDAAAGAVPARQQF